jgi:anti-sigma factor RsiW
MPEIATECLTFAEDLSALIDAELDAPREAEVRAHVATCASCAEFLEDLCNADLALAGLSTPAPAADLHARFEARRTAAAVDARSPQTVRRAPPRARRRGLALGIASGLAAAAAVLLALLLGVPRDVSEPGMPIARETTPDPEVPSQPGVPEADVIAEVPEPALVEPAVPQTPERIAAEPELPRAPLPETVPSTDAGEPASQLAALEALPDEDAALLLDLDTVAELDLMANLDLLEAMVDLGMTDGA